MIELFNMLLQKKKKEQEFKEQVEASEEFKKAKRREEEPSKTEKTKKYEEFRKKNNELVHKWAKKWGYKVRGVDALLWVLWMSESSDKNVIKKAEDVLSKLKGQDIFGKFMKILKLKPEGKMA